MEKTAFYEAFVAQGQPIGCRIPEGFDLRAVLTFCRTD
jgi:hypothetical protein